MKCIYGEGIRDSHYDLKPGLYVQQDSSRDLERRELYSGNRASYSR